MLSMSNKLKNLLGFENLEGFLFEAEDAKKEIRANV